MEKFKLFLNQSITWLFVCCCLFILSCSEGTLPTASDKANIVISGFLYANEQINDIRVVNITPAGTKDTTVIVFDSTLNDYDTMRIMPVVPINDAVVTIYANGVVYPLVSLNDSGFYGDPSNSINVTTGVTYRIEAQYLGKTAIAETIVPESALNLTVSRDTLFRARGGKNNNNKNQLDSSLYIAKLQWYNPDRTPYYVVIQQTEVAENNNNKNPNPKPNNGGGLNRGRGYFTRNDTISITSLREKKGKQKGNVTSLTTDREGTYEIKIYRVNNDYRELDQFINQQNKAERDGMGFLEEPPSNVVGGLGIFAAFTSTAKTIYVVKQQ